MDMIFAVLPQTVLFVRYPAEGELQAYCIATMRETFRADNVVSVMEIAGVSDDAARQVLRGVGAEATSRGRTVSTIGSVDGP